MNGLSKTLVAIITTLFIAFSGFAQSNKENYGIKNVLYVSSSHDTYYPSSEILAGATQYFKEHQVKIDLKTIYLNSRYVHNKDSWRGTVISEMNKLIDKQVDLLIVSGPEAIAVIDSLDDPRIKNTPAIYCGTISIKDVKRPNISGVLFNFRYDEVVSIAEKMYPDLENIYLVGDQGSYSAQLIQIAQNQLSKYSYKYNIIVNTDLGAVNDVLIFLKSLPENSFVMILNWQKTKSGDFCDWTIYYQLFAQNATSPIYRHVKDLVSEDYALAPDRYLYKHGLEVGAIGLELLSGVSSSKIPIKSPKITWAVSQNWLTKEGVDPAMLPDNVHIITESKESINQNSLLLVLFVGLSIPIVILLSQLLFKNKRIKKDTLSISILRNEVTNVIKQFENEHALLDGILNSITDGAIIIEIDTNRVVNANPLAASILHLELKDVLGRKIDEIMSMRQGDIAIDVNGYIRSVITNGQKIDFSTKEVFIVCRNGKRVQCNGSFTLLSRHTSQEKELSGVLLIINDTTEAQVDLDRLNYSLSSLNITTWAFDIPSRTITFMEGEDPLSRVVGSAYSIDTISQFVQEDQRREFHAFWTDLVRDEHKELRLELFLDFSGSGKYEPWLFMGYSHKGKSSPEMVIFGSMSLLSDRCPSQLSSTYNSSDLQTSVHIQSESFLANEDHEFPSGIHQKATILIAEDNDSNFLLISKLLKNRYNLFRAMNGEQAIVLARRERPDIILMDMNMPVLDGASATQIIRSTDHDTPIYALTASVYDSDKLKTIEAGCTGYLSKPVNKDALFEVLKKHCGY